MFSIKTDLILEWEILFNNEEVPGQQGFISMNSAIKIFL